MNTAKFYRIYEGKLLCVAIKFVASRGALEQRHLKSVPTSHKLMTLPEAEVFMASKGFSRKKPKITADTPCVVEPYVNASRVLELLK